jgi:hypothetical protein
MYRATKILIEERQKYNELPVKLVYVRNIPIKSKNQCFENAVECEHLDILKSGSTKNEIISGWIVFPYNKVDDSTEITQHWWNYDPVSKIHFDVTEYDEVVKLEKKEFVMDLDIKNYGVRHLDEIKSNVGKDIILKDGKWFSIEIDEKDFSDLKKLDDISTRNILIWK